MEIAQIELLLVDPVKRRLLLFAAVLIGCAIVLGLIRHVARWARRPERAVLLNESLLLDLSELPTTEPGLPRVTVYHIPVRLAVVVIAPLGRESDPPKHSEVPLLLDQIVPGLASALSRDQTIVRIWPRQLSATGFAPSLMRHVRLPSDRGRSSPWCLVSGRTTFNNASYSIGLALCAATPNNLGLVVVESEHEWLDVLRVRPDGER
jgi:hypothetical protein